MKPRLFLIKRYDGLFAPADDQSSDLAKKIQQGDPIEAKIVNHRLLWYHRRFFLAVKHIFNNMPEEMAELYPTEDSLRKALLILAGHVDIVHLPDGQQRVSAASMNFETVKQDEFEKIYSAVVDAGLKYFIKEFDQQQVLIDLT